MLKKLVIIKYFQEEKKANSNAKSDIKSSLQKAITFFKKKKIKSIQISKWIVHRLKLRISP